MTRINMTTINDKHTDYYDNTFENLDLSEQEIAAKNFENCKFIRCNFSETTFEKCKFCDCEFIRSNLSNMSIKHCSINNMIFTDSKVVGVNWTKAAWPRINLACPLYFMQCDISHSIFYALNLSEASIIECRATNVDFRDVNLTRANLSHTDFSESQFFHSNLTEADFSFAENYHIDVMTNKVTKAKFMHPEAASLLHGLDIELVDG